MASKVFFSREITPEKVVEMYQLADKKLSGKVAVKLHSGGKSELLKTGILETHDRVYRWNCGGVQHCL